MLKYFYQTTVWRLLVQIIGFLLNLLIARYFGAAQSGDLFYLLSIYSLIILFFSFSLESGIVYFGTKKIIKFNQLISFSLLIAAISIAVIFLYFQLAPNSHTLIKDNKLLFWSALSFITGNLLYSFAGSLFYAKNNFTLQHKVAFAAQSILLFILILKWMGFLPALTDTTYFLFYFISYLGIGLFCFLLFLIQQKEKFIFSLPNNYHLKILFSYCGLAWLGNLIFFLLYRIDYVFVENLCNAAELGNYIQVSKIAQLFFILPTILASIVFPLTISKPKDQILRWITGLSRFIFFIYVIVCIIAIACGYWLFPFVFGDTFTDMYVPFVLLVPGILSLSVSFTLTAYFAGIKKLDVNIKASLLALIIVLIGNFMALNFYSINVAAIVSSLSYFFLMIYLIAVIKKQQPIPTSAFFIFKLQDFADLKSIILNSKK